MNFRDELISVYKAADNSEAVFAACDEFIKPKLIEAAKSRQKHLKISVKELPQLIASNGDKLRKWTEEKGLQVWLVGESVVFEGWASKPRPVSDTEWILSALFY